MFCQYDVELSNYCQHACFRWYPCFSNTSLLWPGFADFRFCNPMQWPPLIEVVDDRELPSVLIERYEAAGGEGTALCGTFPDIRRAWASQGNSLVLWRFDKWDGQCLEYSSEEQAICAVGLVKVKPGIFVKSIQYLLVLATPVKLLLIGVCCSASDGDPYAKVSLQHLPEYEIPSNGVTTTCIASTNRGDIFLAGHDGHIYGMFYRPGSVRHERCSKFCLTFGWLNDISRLVVPNGFKFGSVDPVVDMVVDNERHILYTRTEKMKIQAYSLGPNWDEYGRLKKVAEEKLFIDHGDQYGGRQSAGSRVPARSAKTSIVCISPLSTVESKWLHLVAILSDGRRMYLSTTHSSGSNGTIGGLGGFIGNLLKPSRLKVTRPAPPLGVEALSLAGRSQKEDPSLKIESAHYSSATLVLSDSSPVMSSLLIVNRDSGKPSSFASLGTDVTSSEALRECVSSLRIEGRVISVADVLLMPDTAATVQALYAQLEFCGYNYGESPEKLSGGLWARGDLSTQHILPRRRIIIFSTKRMMEVVFNRPVDILRTLLESNTPETILEDFFKRFGPGEAAAMCLMLAARIVHAEQFISNVVSEKAAEAFENPRLVGKPQLEDSGALANARTAAGGFSTGQVVQEAEPVFSGAHEGLCLCTSRLLLPIWELPVLVTVTEKETVECRLSIGAMQVLEDKLHSLEKFLTSRRNQRRGLYGSVAGLGDLTGSTLIGAGADLVSGDRSMVRNLFSPSRNTETNEAGTSDKRQRLPYSSAELADMEVRAMECVRQLLLRCGEALFLLQVLSQHDLTLLLRGYDMNRRRALVQLTFHQLVSSEEADLLATRLATSLMKYYADADGRGTVDDISGRLREGCPRFYMESHYKYYLAVECLRKARDASDDNVRETLAREAFRKWSMVLELADIQAVCKIFERLRYYEAVVRLPLQKAQALDPAGNAVNEQIDAGVREHALAQREQCYEIIASALRALKGEASPREFGSATRPSVVPYLSQNSRKKYICQIIQLGVQSSDRIFHDYLYRTLIDLGLEDEILEYGGPDLVGFLQDACREPTQEAISAVTSAASLLHHSEVPISSNQAKYMELLARYYVLKRQHELAALVLLRLAERCSSGPGNFPTLEQRRQYLHNAVLQAKSVGYGDGLTSSSMEDLLEGNLTVLLFQIKIKEELEAIVSRLEASTSTSESLPNDTLIHVLKEKAKELSVNLKSITQLYSDYAVRFVLWQTCLIFLFFFLIKVSLILRNYD